MPLHFYNFLIYSWLQTYSTFTIALYKHLASTNMSSVPYPPHYQHPHPLYGPIPIHPPFHPRTAAPPMPMMHPPHPTPSISPLPPPHLYHHPLPQQRPLLMDPQCNIQQTVHQHNNVVNINNISMNRHQPLPSPYPRPHRNPPPAQILPPPQKKRKLNHVPSMDTSKEQSYQQKIYSLQQDIAHAKLKNKEYEDRVQKMKHDVQRNIHLEQTITMERQEHSATIKLLDVDRKNHVNTIQMLKDNAKTKKRHHAKTLQDQSLIIHNLQAEITALKRTVKEQQCTYGALERTVNQKDEEIKDLQSKYKKMKEITANLYLECVNGEEPRWESIQIEKTEKGIVRDKALGTLHQNIRSLYPKGSYKVCGVGKWKNNKTIETAIKAYVQLNGEYTRKSMLILNDTQLKKNMVKKRVDVIQKFQISGCHRIPALNGQFGICALIDIPQHTVCGQYFGGEISVEAFAKVFDGTAVEHDHNVYALDQQIDAKEIEKAVKKSKMNGDVMSTCFVIDPFIVDGEDSNDVLLPFVNDCRADINHMEPTDEDRSYYNVEFVGVKINGWTQTYMITKRDIKKGEELQTYYGDVFGVAVRNKRQNEEAKQTKKIRIDRDILQQLKHEFQSTFRLCKYI
eukprot:158558_1